MVYRFARIGLIALTLSIVPIPTFAASATFLGPIVPAECHCDNQANPNGGTLTTAPDYGCVLQVIQNAINFAITLGIILFVLYLAYAGFRLITSGGSSEARSEGKTRIMNVVIGMVVLLTAWLVVDFVMKTIYNPSAPVGQSASFGPWNAILAPTSIANRCIVAKNPGALSSGTVGVQYGPATSGGGATASSGVTGSSQMNIAQATSFMQNKYSTTVPGGYCWVGVRNGLCAGGLTQFCSQSGYNAYQAGPHLLQAGFTQVYSNKYSYPASESAFAYQPGDVVVFQPVAGHPDGHITMYTGGKWVSDYTQSAMSSNKADYAGGTFVVYRP